MNIPLTRMIEGIIATMRSDVIPYITDSYARGQAVGVIDLLNNLAPRIEWSQAPLHRIIETKRRLLEEVAELVPEAKQIVGGLDRHAETAEDLLVIKRRLDAAIGDAMAFIWLHRNEVGYARAIELVKAHLHDEMAAEMKITRKPLFAEIASGGDGGKSR